MNPQTQFCPNPPCPARGQRGQGNIQVHSQIEQRYRCTPCGQTFAATKSTPFYRLRTAADLVTVVLTLVCHGCPIQAIVAAFGLDERTVAARVAGAFTEPPVSEQLLLLGWAAPSELEEIAAYWRAWGEQPDAFYARAWCEAVGWKG